jgi:peptidoglycan/LPS O-acetylase OafA/YrhL
VKNSIAADKDYFPFIDGLRGIAILMVVAVHTSQRIGNAAAGSFRFPALEHIVNSGARGVQLFFMLSSFTLFSSSKRRFMVDQFPKLSFYIRRAFRILPFWWIMVLFYVIREHQRLQEAFPSLFLYFGFIRFRPGTEVFPVGWSIFVEETFYLLLPVVFGYVLSLTAAVRFAVATWVLSFLWVIFAPKLGVPDTNAFIGLFPLTQWFCFGLGILAFYVFKHDLFKSEILSKKTAGLALDGIAFALLCAFVTGSDLHSAAIALSTMLMAAMHPAGIFGKIARNPILMRFGGYCYSIYLFHMALLDYFVPLTYRYITRAGLMPGWLRLWVDARFLIAFPVIALLSLGLGYLTFNGIEKPCVQLGRKVIAKLRPFHAAFLRQKRV